MLIIALLVALAVFTLILAVYNYSQRESVTVSKRIKNYADNGRNARRKAKANIWESLNESQYKESIKHFSEYAAKMLPKHEHFMILAERADLPLSGSELMVLLLGSSLCWFLLLSVLMLSLYKGLVLSLLWFSMWYFYVKELGAKRMREFDAQLGDAIVMMNNGLRAGFTFQQAMDTISKELPEPMSGEFSRALKEVHLGVSVEDALGGISKRMQSDDFDLLATAVVIQRQVGGNLSQIFDTIGITIRDRVKLKREIKVLTAEGIFAGWIVGLMPVVLCAILLFLNPHYFDTFMAQSYAKYVIGACIVSEALGALIIKRIVDVKV